MKKHINKICCVFLIIVFASGLLITAYAHPGRTDSAGGHYNRSTGEYHYHHGYSAHQHTNGECPYDSNYNKKPNSDTNNSTTSDNNSSNNSSNKKTGLLFGFIEKESIYPWIFTTLVLSVFPILCVYYDIKQKKQDNAIYKKKIFDYYGETIRIGPFSKKNKELAFRCKQIDDEIIKNKKQIALLNIENVDLPFLFRYIPKDIQINQNLKIEYLEASKELPFGKYTAFYRSSKTLHFKEGCYDAFQTTSTLELNPLYFNPKPNICSRCCPTNFEKDYSELFSPQWYIRYTQITKKMQDFDIQLADLTFSEIDKKSKTYGQLMDDRLDNIFKEHFNSDDIDSYIDNEMREYLDKKYSLLKRLKKDGIYSFIHDMPDFIEITSDFLLKSKKPDNTFGKYTVYLSNKTIHRTVHFNEKYTRTASYDYYMFRRPVANYLCEECWSNIPPDEREKLINPNWHKEYLAIVNKINKYNLHSYKIFNKDEDTTKKSPAVKYCIQLWSAAKNQWLRKNHYIE